MRNNLKCIPNFHKPDKVNKIPLARNRSMSVLLFIVMESLDIFCHVIFVTTCLILNFVLTPVKTISVTNVLMLMTVYSCVLSRDWAKRYRRLLSWPTCWRRETQDHTSL